MKPNQTIRIDDWVMVFGSRIGEYDFVGQVIALVDVDRDHDWYEVANPDLGLSIICCCHLIEKVHKPSEAALRQVGRAIRRVA